MTVSQTESIHKKRVESFPLEAQDKGIKATSSGLHQVFQKDKLGSTPQPAQVLSKTIDLESSSPTFWKKLFSWAYTPEADKHGNPVIKTSLKKPEPIDSVPVLEDPDLFSKELEGIKLPPSTKSRTSRKVPTHSEVVEGLLKASDKTIEEIMFIVMRGLLALKKEDAHVAENTFTKYQQLKKLEDKVLEQIKDTLAKDENFLSWMKTGQNIAFAASFVCGLATAALAIGIPLVGVPLTLATYGPIVTAGLTALATGTTAYAQRLMNEDKAKHEEYRHREKTTNERIEESLECLSEVAKADEAFKQRLIELSKKLTRLHQFMVQK